MEHFFDDWNFFARRVERMLLRWKGGRGKGGVWKEVIREKLVLSFVDCFVFTINSTCASCGQVLCRKYNRLNAIYGKKYCNYKEIWDGYRCWIGFFEMFATNDTNVAALGVLCYCYQCLVVCSKLSDQHMCFFVIRQKITCVSVCDVKAQAQKMFESV